MQAVAAVEGKGAMPVAPSISRQVCPALSHHTQQLTAPLAQSDASARAFWGGRNKASLALAHGMSLLIRDVKSLVARDRLEVFSLACK